MNATTTTTSLYDRLGGHDGIARITRTLIANHMANPLVSSRWSASDMPQVEKRSIEFICAGAGGPETYTGKDMLATHKGMNISEQEFVVVIDDAMAALTTHEVDAATRNEVLAMLWSLKGDVVRS
ncbi:MAG: group 1 truncated hemoglobin [Burkholderiaceae bacterium]